MRDNIVKNFFFALVLLTATMPAHSQQAVELLSSRLATMQAFKARFNQQIKDEKGALLQEASGEIIIQRPRKLYWSTQQPYQHLVVTDGKLLWIYDIDLEQINQKPFSAELDQAPALLLSGEIKTINEHYEISSTMLDGDILQFLLLPRNEGNVFQRMTIDFKDQQLLAMSLTDNFGQLTVIIFSDLQLNPAIDPTIFNFSPPENVDVSIDES